MRKMPRSLDAVDRGHLRLNLLGLLFQGAQVVAVELDGQLAFDAGDGLFHVVGDGLRVVPDDAGKLLQLLVHGGDQRFLVLMEDGPPLLLRLEIDEVFGVEEAGGVGAVVGAAGLADDLRDLRERGHHDARLVGEVDAGGGAFAGRQRAAHPDGAFVEMGQELRADGPADGEIDGDRQTAPRRCPGSCGDARMAARTAVR